MDLDTDIRDLSEESIIPLIITILFKHNVDMASGSPSYDRKMKVKRFLPSISLGRIIYFMREGSQSWSKVVGLMYQTLRNLAFSHGFNIVFYQF